MLLVLMSGSYWFKMSWRSAVFGTMRSKERPFVKKLILCTMCWGKVPEESPGKAVVQLCYSGDSSYWGCQDY